MFLQASLLGLLLLRQPRGLERVDLGLKGRDLGFLTGAGQRDEHNRGENTDDRDNDEEFDQGETFVCFIHIVWLIIPLHQKSAERSCLSKN